MSKQNNGIATISNASSVICSYFMLTVVNDKTSSQSEMKWTKRAVLILTNAFRPEEAVCERGIWYLSFSLAGILWAVKGIGNIQLHTSLHTVCIELWWAWSRWGVTGISSKLSGPCIFFLLGQNHRVVVWLMHCSVPTVRALVSLMIDECCLKLLHFLLA